MVFSEAGGEGTLLSLLVSEKLSAMRGILLIVVYLFKLESEVEPSRLDLRWLKGPDDEKIQKLVKSMAIWLTIKKQRNSLELIRRI